MFWVIKGKKIVGCLKISLNFSCAEAVFFRVHHDVMTTTFFFFFSKRKKFCWPEDSK